MKKIIAILLLSFICHFIYANKFEVGKNMPFKSIKSALDKIENGDTIYVHEGIYKEGNIILSKTVNLIGVNFPILDGQNKYEILSIKAANTLVSGFRIQHSGFATLDDPCAIKVYDTRNVIICNNILDDNFFGIYLQFSKNCIIKNNQIKAYGIEE
ncbi:MAG: right-handed parallel beta-helix repeat-containing protein, partial [Bacteroidia bacterium]|nr:right-handed parallel beta-helix repeat-containing protein [Bacteroidia bacterium]